MILQETEEYICSHSTPEDELLQELNRETNLKVMYPRMLSGQVQGKLLEMMSRMIKPEHILEIGTYTGYSAICLARGLAPKGILHTIEVNPELTEMANRYFIKAGLENKIIQHTGDAVNIISGINEVFDLVFIDAAKELYPLFYELVFPKVKPGGYILADNVLWDEKVLGSNKKPDRETEGIRQFNDLVRDDNRVENVLLSVRDGLMLIQKKP